MAIKAAFKLQDKKDYINQQIALAYQALIQTFQYVGESFVRNARLSGNYNDITGNLRSSIGYIILQDGKQLYENFEEGPNGTDKQTGVLQGQLIAEEIAASYPKGIVLICVAGMDYALYVESTGREVISESAGEASRMLTALLKEL